MILTKEQVAARLNSEKNLANKIKESKVEIVIKDSINNHNGNKKGHNLTENERVAIGALANTVGSETAASIFGISTSHARDLKYGNRNVGNGESNSQRIKDIDLVNKIQERLESTKLTITERAAEKLLGALGLLSEEKMENCTARDLASVSSQVSQVIRNMNSNGERNNNGAKVQIVLHQPKPSREDHFDMVEIGVK